ncbi:ComEA family DNA-binding protein [Aquimarina agarivorans]|uniref:ComEA family DNA-binding protein n=1 Tax=Aquimarina agarivorans TaxID=980584 RepID=UPI001EE63FCC|nr:helix-hairpin-helix domain-containing protein [Aquimarina agarivorans]
MVTSIILGIVLYTKIPRNNPSFILDKEAQCFIDNKKLVLAELDKKKQHTYYVNSLSDFTGYQLGLSSAEIDRLLAYRETGKRIYSQKEFQKITQIDQTKLDSIKSLLRFPKQKLSKKQRLKRKPKNSYKSIRLTKKLNLNTVSAKELQQKLQLPNFIANRIVRFRASLGGFNSIDQLDKVYDILPYQLVRLKTNGFVKNTSE